ncbi:MAG TPA: phosphodiester glycosidase family protein [Phycisphaerae bacterium]|nr:hypothetical protein [Phycisphaerae bacterium]HOB74335.1 phosphodiester glycosidase family protein [Phycisphaerae bacterium]HOJ53074.1 phosphodiester glycosidase family protein [Phycisphaerae bacterium]HOL24811.1 phosphodiester glycosidase family protein [Phycisphaerae bacterium]HPP19347.1 phosphodiester glycosidase family protein [Phycisphaerae bacterium]
MVISRKVWGWAVTAALLVCSPLAAQWTTVGIGIEYREWTLPGPYRLYVARMERANSKCWLESMIAQGKLYSGLERVTDQAARYDDAINYADQIWGQRNDIVVAINGDFWNTSTNRPTGGQIQSGWYCWRFPQFGGWSGMGWTTNRYPFMGGCLHHPPSDQLIHYLGTGASDTFTGINEARGSNSLIIYTHHYDSHTHTDNTGVEVLVEMSRPLLILTAPNMVTGVVREIRQNKGSTYIPFDHIVLSATGSKAATLLANVSVGSQIGISQRINDYLPALGTGEGCASFTGADWTKTYAVVGGNFTFLRNGIVQSTTNEGLIIRNPRTAVAYNDNYIFFIVVDGRQPGWSIGMNMTELANFCLNELGATWGYNQDGGGSSAMVVNGVLKNRPSDGSERLVANGLAMINVLPKQQSTMFRASDEVRVMASTASLRLGPGTNFGSFTTLGNGTPGAIINHSLAGVYAKSTYWWKCDFNGNVGWIDQNQIGLRSGGQPPFITSHPANQTVLHGATVVLSVEAEGTEPFAFQWQKDGVDLVNDGRRSGVLTSTLTITEATGSDNAQYRCRITNEYGTTDSNAATLTVRSPDLDRDDDVDQDDFGIFQACLTGTGEPVTDPACYRAKLDLDDDVDDQDLARFRNCLMRPGVLPPANCMGTQ